MANDAFYVAETRQSFPMVTTTEENAKTMVSGDGSGAQGGSPNDLFESLDSSRANGFSSGCGAMKGAAWTGEGPVPAPATVLVGWWDRGQESCCKGSQWRV